MPVYLCLTSITWACFKHWLLEVIELSWGEAGSSCPETNRNKYDIFVLPKSDWIPWRQKAWQNVLFLTERPDSPSPHGRRAEAGRWPLPHLCNPAGRWIHFLISETSGIVTHYVLGFVLFFHQNVFNLFCRSFAHQFILISVFHL